MLTNLRRLRKQRGLSQNDLARKADLTPPAIHYLESGKGGPTLATARRLAAALDCTVDDLDREPAPDDLTGKTEHDEAA